MPFESAVSKSLGPISSPKPASTWSASTQLNSTNLSHLQCKVALEYKTRFWEHFSNPIFGGCSTSTDIPGVGSICYPSYCLNCTGPASLLASYASGDWGARWVSVPEAEHVQYMVDAMAEIHGPIAHEQFTGKYNRRCWMLDEYEGGSWASPTVGQHQLYLPEYFKTYNNVRFFIPLFYITIPPLWVEKGLVRLHAYLLNKLTRQ